jgi:hypothetical protein
VEVCATVTLLLFMILGFMEEEEEEEEVAVLRATGLEVCVEEGGGMFCCNC